MKIKVQYYSFPFSHENRKDSLELSLDSVLLDFPKILVPKLHQRMYLKWLQLDSNPEPLSSSQTAFQNASNVNNECAGKSKQLYSM